jgi:hypothetical protein
VIEGLLEVPDAGGGDARAHGCGGLCGVGDDGAGGGSDGNGGGAVGDVRDIGGGVGSCGDVRSRGGVSCVRVILNKSSFVWTR